MFRLATSRKRKDNVAAKAEIKAGQRQQQAILDTLRPMARHGVVRSREEFSALITEAFMKAGIALRAPLFKAILMALGEWNETAEACRDRRGRPEPDTDLHDYENVPLKEDIHEYMVREVLPHVPDAWVEESKTKVGYEINFNRYFYKYTPPRPLEEIEADLRQIEQEIAEMLVEVVR